MTRKPNIWNTVCKNVKPKTTSPFQDLHKHLRWRVLH